MFTNQTRAAPAMRTDQLADDIADRIAIACHPDEIEGLIADAWVKHRDGRLTANDLETLPGGRAGAHECLPGGWDRHPAETTASLFRHATGHGTQIPGLARGRLSAATRKAVR
jgi:hypothetical protein